MTNEKFVHLHTHSHYSLLDGLSSTEELVQTAVSLGYKSLALTDHGTCAGLYRFQKDCHKHGIKPILGMEAYITADHTIKEKSAVMNHILLLAKNEVGYKNLIKLSSFGYTDGFYKKPRIDFSVLEAHKEGLIVSSACPISEFSCLLLNGDTKAATDLVGKYMETFKDDFYVEIMFHRYHKEGKDQEGREKFLARELRQIAKKLNVKAICTHDIHYAKANNALAHDCLLSVQTKNKIKNPDRFSFHSDDFYMKSPEEMLELYKKAPDLLINTVEIAEKIEDNLIKTSEDLLPSFNVPEGCGDEESYLKSLVTDGMKKKGLVDKPEYRERIKYEMGIITKCGYTKYFLILWDIINFTERSGIRIGIGRGCFLPDNKVLTKNGLQNIQDISNGDEVLSYDGEYHEVIDTMNYDIDEEIITIEIDDGRQISCTLDHKIHVKRNNSLVWIEAKDLNNEDNILDINFG